MGRARLSTRGLGLKPTGQTHVLHTKEKGREREREEGNWDQEKGERRKGKRASQVPCFKSEGDAASRSGSKASPSLPLLRRMPYVLSAKQVQG